VMTVTHPNAHVLIPNLYLSHVLAAVSNKVSTKKFASRIVSDPDVQRLVRGAHALESIQDDARSEVSTAIVESTQRSQRGRGRGAISHQQMRLEAQLIERAKAYDSGILMTDYQDMQILFYHIIQIAFDLGLVRRDSFYYEPVYHVTYDDEGKTVKVFTYNYKRKCSIEDFVYDQCDVVHAQQRWKLLTNRSDMYRSLIHHLQVNRIPMIPDFQPLDCAFSYSNGIYFAGHGFMSYDDPRIPTNLQTSKFFDREFPFAHVAPCKEIADRLNRILHARSESELKRDDDTGSTEFKLLRVNRELTRIVSNMGVPVGDALFPDEDVDGQYAADNDDRKAVEEEQHRVELESVMGLRAHLTHRSYDLEVTQRIEEELRARYRARVAARGGSQYIERLSDVVDWRDVPTPHLQRIMEDQHFPEDVQEWFMAMLGRMLARPDEWEHWQVVFCIFGVAGSGKSTVAKIVELFRRPEDIWTIGDNMEETFGLSGALGCKCGIAYDITSRTKFKQADWLSIVANDKVCIARKCKEVLEMRLKIHLMMLGNSRLPYDDSQDQVSRRKVPFSMTERITNGDPYIEAKNQQNVACLMFKCYSAYLEKCALYSDCMLTSILPQYFIDQRRREKAESHQLEHFIQNGTDDIEVTRNNDDFMMWREFTILFNMHCKRSGLLQAKMVPEFYGQVLKEHGLRLTEHRTAHVNGVELRGQMILGVRARNAVAETNEP